MSDYYYENESEQFAFYRIPKQLFTDERFAELSTDAKPLYGLLLDRMSLSAKNKWFDNGRVYIFFTVEQVRGLLHFGQEKICKLFSELDSFGLIERKRQGQGKAVKIFPHRFTLDTGQARDKISANTANPELNAFMS